MREISKQIQDRYLGVVAFDLDGTLIRGIRHSWSLLWKAVGCSRSGAIQFQKAFVNGEIDYKQWVQHDFETLRDNGLTVDKIYATIEKCKCSLTKNFKKAILKLKENKYIVAIISGGVDVVLKYFLPNPHELFDVVFINELKWDKQGNLINIVPTEYDWDSGKKGVAGKCAGLRKICADYNVPLCDSVFVGNDDNDLAAMQVAGRKVFFSAENFKYQEKYSDIYVEPRNDLMRVAEFIIDTCKKI